MHRWQYAWLTDQPQAMLGFSHPQPGLAGELAAVLGPGVWLQQSTDWSISLDRSRVNLGYLSGLMGDRGWEMFSVETRMQPGAYAPNQLQTNWYFKRPMAEISASQVMSSAAAQQPAPMAPTAGGMAPAAGGTAPMAPAGPAAPRRSGTWLRQRRPHLQDHPSRRSPTSPRGPSRVRRPALALPAPMRVSSCRWTGGGLRGARPTHTLTYLTAPDCPTA